MSWPDVKLIPQTNKQTCQGKTQGFGKFAKTQGILFAQIVNSQLLKLQDIAIVPTNFQSCQSHFLHIKLAQIS